MNSSRRIGLIFGFLALAMVALFSVPVRMLIDHSIEVRGNQPPTNLGQQIADLIGARVDDGTPFQAGACYAAALDNPFKKPLVLQVVERRGSYVRAMPWHGDGWGGADWIEQDRWRYTFRHVGCPQPAGH